MIRSAIAKPKGSKDYVVDDLRLLAEGKLHPVQNLIIRMKF